MSTLKRRLDRLQPRAEKPLRIVYLENRLFCLESGEAELEEAKKAHFIAHPEDRGATIIWLGESDRDA
jgi:hypothetical protein